MSQVSKMLKAVFILLTCLATLMGCETTQTPESAREQKQVIVGASIDDLATRLKALKITDEYPLRVYYHGDCAMVGTQFFESIPFPIQSLNPSTSDGGALEKVTSLFTDESKINTYIDDAGMLRLHIGNSIDYPLFTNVDSFGIPSNVRHEPGTVVDYIANTPETKEVMKRFGLQQTATLSVFSLQPGYSDDSPQVPENFGDLTLNEALDVVASVFRRVVVYSTCDTHYSIKIY